MRVVNVSLGSRSYRILIGTHLLERIGIECRGLKLGRRCTIIFGLNVAPIYGSRCLAELRAAGFDPVLICVPAGETAKSLKTLQSCYNELAKHRLERSSFIIALGGGVVGDLAGFVAATYL